MQQQELQLEAQRQRDIGINRAVDHADRVHADWSDRAYDTLVDYTRILGSGCEVTSERIRQNAEANGLPKPPDNRAWGAVMLKAARAGVLKKIGWTTANDPKVHCNPVSLWVVQ